MNIHSLRIEGFRKHKDTTILFSDSTFLIGENNVGKSSVLVALDYLLNIKSKIPEEEFYSVVDANGSIIRKVNEVILTAEFRNLPEESKEWRGFRGRIIPYTPSFDGDTGLSFVYRKTFCVISPCIFEQELRSYGSVALISHVFPAPQGKRALSFCAVCTPRSPPGNKLVYPQ